MRLPKASPANSGDIAMFLDQIVLENARDNRRSQWVLDAGRGMDLYLGNHFLTDAPNEVRVVLNRIQNAIVSLFAIQGGDPPAVTFRPRETGDPSIYYLDTRLPEGAAIAQQLSLDPMQPLPPEVAAKLEDDVEMGKAMANQAMAAGTPPPAGILPPEVLIEVNDATTAEALQTVFDGMWESCDCQYTLAENVLFKNILGLQSTLYEFDDATKRHILTNVHQLQVFIDNLRSDYARSQYLIYDEPVDADEATALYPHLAAEIMEFAKTGPIQFPGSRSYDPGHAYLQTFNRDMIAIRHAWFRNQPFPMTRAQAVAQGHVVEQDVPTGEVVPQADPATGGDVPVPATRKAMIHPETGAELTEGGPGWPIRYGIRQLRVIANRCVDDRECEFDDIPLPTNANLIVPYSPYAQGEPCRLEGLQMALNYVLSAIVTHQRYNAVPPEFIPASVQALMDKALREVRTNPGQRVVVPDALLQMFGDVKKLVMTVDVPALPADFWKLLQFLVDIIDREGNQADVLQGDASSAWSGEAIASLQSAASQVIRAKSMPTEFYLRRLVRLMVRSITDRMGPDDWARYVTHVPYQALAAMHTRNKSMECDISVEIKSASGSAKNAETNNLMQARQLNLPISDETLLDRLGLDAKTELQRNLDQQRKLASLAPPPAAPAGAAPNNDANKQTGPAQASPPAATPTGGRGRPAPVPAGH